MFIRKGSLEPWFSPFNTLLFNQHLKIIQEKQLVALNMVVQFVSMYH